MVAHKQAVLRSLQKLPNVGNSIAIDLWDLGIRAPQDLQGRDPEVMYEDLCSLRRTHIDRCMLYVLRALVYVASAKEVDPEMKMWWKWKDPAPTKRGSKLTSMKARSRRSQVINRATNP